MKSTVDVYEVGIHQLRDLVDSDISQGCGNWVVVGMLPMFGGFLPRLTLVGRYDSEYWACRSAQNMGRISLWNVANGGSRYAQEYEVWHVVDDAELWQSWEHDVAVAKRQRNEPTDWHVYYNFKCVLDLDYVPTCLYHLVCETADCSYISDEWYEDESKFADALGMSVSHGCLPFISGVLAMSDRVSIVDDDCLELDDYGDSVVLTVTCLETC